MILRTTSATAASRSGRAAYSPCEITTGAHVVKGDPFGGSGSTLIACEQTGRVCYTVELDEKFCDVIVNRYKEQVGSASGITCQRDGLTYTYDEILKLSEPSE